MSDTDKFKIIATNRKANFEYEILNKYEAGFVITGTEVKSLREGKVNLQESYGRIINDEAWVINLHINEYKYGNINNHEPLRNRKLVVKQKGNKKDQKRTSGKGTHTCSFKNIFQRFSCKSGDRNSKRKKTIR